MKLSTVGLILLYVAIFGVGAYFLYTKYYNQLANFGTKNENVVEKKDTNQIYYAQGNNLYQLNAEITDQEIKNEPTLRIQSTGEVKNIAMTSDREPTKTFFYDSKNSDQNWEIYRVELKSNNSQKVFSPAIAGLENFTDFKNPVISPDDKYVAFTGIKIGGDSIFMAPIKEPAKITNLTGLRLRDRINQISWSPDNKKIAFVSKADKYRLNIVDTVSLSIDTIFDDVNPIKQIAWQNIGLMYDLESSEGDKTVSNLYLLNPQTKDKKAITNLVYPKNINHFVVSKNEKNIAMDINDQANKNFDLYVSDIDGTNLLQLTSDGQASQAVFSPNGKTVAFWQDKEGIYSITINKESKKKILNLKNKPGQIIFWR